MGKPLRVLMVEDSEDDVLLTIRALKKAGYAPEYERVETAVAMRKALRERTWDVILCDYQMPQFNGLAAIALLKETGIDIPLIIVSGAIGEETAAECMRSGAHDYVMKGNLSRLTPAIQRESKEAESRIRLKRAEEELKKSKTLLESIFNSSQDLILVVDRDLKVLLSNWKSPLYAGHTEFPINSHCYEAFIHRDTPCEQCHASGVFSNGKPILTEYYNQNTKLFMEVNAYPIFDDDNHVILVAENVRDITERKQAAERIRKALRATTQAIAVTVETRDPYTAGHQRRTADLARSIATEMNLPDDQIDGIRMAATIHDLGKISVPAEILSKPTKLKKMEFDLIKAHSQSGYDILKDIDFSWPIARTVLEHHERMDGSGYPNGLTGDNILMESRIIAVADVVESMASHRPYRPSLGIEAALEEIEKNRGTHYDHAVADACLRLFREKGYQLP